MLTTEQKTEFMLALAADNIGADTKEEVSIDDSYCPSLDQVIDCSDTIEHFFEAQGTRRKRDGAPSRELHKNETVYGVIYVWTDVQAAKGLRRAAYFSGEPPRG